mmetsp:Transcript_4925/g.11955  ORF Transcript_4925/g.11955 Transcript_4925/m.11955 type:complete len:235 (+) Transcript_4925:2486-3190(+)
MGLHEGPAAVVVRRHPSADGARPLGRRPRRRDEVLLVVAPPAVPLRHCPRSCREEGWGLRPQLLGDGAAAVREELQQLRRGREQRVARRAEGADRITGHRLGPVAPPSACLGVIGVEEPKQLAELRCQVGDGAAPEQRPVQERQASEPPWEGLAARGLAILFHCHQHCPPRTFGVRGLPLGLGAVLCLCPGRRQRRRTRRRSRHGARSPRQPVWATPSSFFLRFLRLRRLQRVI